MPVFIVPLLAFLLPVLVIFLCKKFPVLDKVGGVILCYALGIIAVNVGLVPKTAADLQQTLSEITVVLAIPLLLFSIKVKEWAGIAGKSLIAFAMAVIAVVAVTVVSVQFLKPHEPEAWKIGGMAVGVYVGGTPNLVSVKTALGVENDTFLRTQAYDTLIGFLYLLFVSTFARPVFRLILPAYKNKLVEAHDPTPADHASAGVVLPAGTGGGNAVAIDGGSAAYRESEQPGSFTGMFRKENIGGLFAALGVAVLVVGAGFGIGQLFAKEAQTAVIILAITSLGIAASFIKPVRRIKKSFDLGMYFIYVFCFVVATLVDVSIFTHIDLPLLLFLAVCTFGSMIVQALLCAIFRVDADTFIITSVSTILSPPFVSVVAGSLKNRSLIVPGITTGIIGYAIGNYLGVSIAYLIR